MTQYLPDYQLFHATRGNFLARLGRGGEARAAYQQAHDLATNQAERTLLAKLAGPSRP